MLKVFVMDKLEKEKLKYIRVTAADTDKNIFHCMKCYFESQTLS